MSRSQNSLITSDVVTTPIKLKYSSSYTLDTFEAVGMTVLSGVNGPVTITGSVPHQTLNYRSIRNLFYSNYLSGSIPLSSSAAENYLMSTAALGSGDADIRIFPTSSGAHISILSVPRNVFGEKLSRRSFILSSSAYYIKDDGNGNLVDYANGNAHVGNIIYNQGMVILTHEDYQEILFFPTTTTTTTTTIPPTTTTTTTTIPPTTTTTTTSTSTTTTTLPPAYIVWQNNELGSPYIDSDLSIDDDGSNVVSSFITEGGNFFATAGSAIYSQQDSQTGTIGNYRLYIENTTDSIVLYDNTSTPGSLPATVNSYTFNAQSGKSYYISASVAEIPPTTTTTTTTTIPPTTTSTTTTTTIPPTTTSTTTTTTIPPTTTTTTTTSTSTTTTTVNSVQHFRSVTPQLDSNTACNQSTPTSVYTSLGDSTMSNGVTFYTDAALTTPFNGASQWWKILWKGAVGFDDEYGVQINSSGVVIAFNFCPAPTTTSTTTSTTTAPPAPATTTSTTTTTTTEFIAYNYYTLTPCSGGSGTDYRSVLALGLGEVYTFQPFPPARACYTVTSISASPTTNDLPTVYGVADCNDPNCVQV